jgi:hypothetical protein
MDIDRGYLENPYHSFLHGVDVFQVPVPLAHTHR